MSGFSAGVSVNFSLGGPDTGNASKDEAPWSAFRFHLEFVRESLTSTSNSSSQGGSGSAAPMVCQGAFSEVTGLEATQEPKFIREGGLNYGGHQRPGQVTFATVVLKRGMTSSRDLWTWFFNTVQGSSGPAWGERLTVYIKLQGADGRDVLCWQLDRAMPVKFRASDLHGAGTELAIEELHLAHEGLRVSTGGSKENHG
jgi:phage tail-like protein